MAAQSTQCYTRILILKGTMGLRRLSHLIDANSLCSCCASAWALSLSPLFASSTNFLMSCSAVCQGAQHYSQRHSVRTCGSNMLTSNDDATQFGMLSC